MDQLQVSPPSTNDGLYDLAELPSEPAKAPPPPPTPGGSAAIASPFSIDTTPRAKPSAASAPTAVAPETSQVGAISTTDDSKPKAAARASLMGGLFGKKKPKEAPAAVAETQAETTEAKKAVPAAPKLVRKKKKAGLRFTAPAWVASLLVHVGVLGLLATIVASTDGGKKVLANLNASLVADKGGETELTPILADPTNGAREETVGSTLSTGSAGLGSGVGVGAPSATPSVGASNRVGERTSLPQVKIAPQLSGLAMLPSMPSKDLTGSAGGPGGGSKISGDVTRETHDIGDALDQLAREILRHLQSHKLTVVWLFDESESMKDDQRAVRDKFDRVASELKLNLDDDQKAKGALNHVIAGFGSRLDFELEKPTTDVDRIRKTIDQLKIDSTGTEDTMHALQGIMAKYGGLISKDRKMMIILVTDESSDDGSYVEEARQSLLSRGVPLYVVGRQAVFGSPIARLVYVDPVTKDTYWPQIRRGPETAGLESYQFDGLHDRWDEQPSGFAPYELARLVKDTGGIYFLLPSEEGMRLRQREKAYSISTLKEYVPDYESRRAYDERRGGSELRRTIFEIVQASANRDNAKGINWHYRLDFSIDPNQALVEIAEEFPKAQIRLTALIEVEKKLRSIQKYRDREPEKRWQAAYDLMLAQTVAYQVASYEYVACLKEMVVLFQKGQLKPKEMPSATRHVFWHLDHSRDKKAPAIETEKKYAEATRLIELVKTRHPKTPWSDLAQDELTRGFGCNRYEWHHDPRYNERAKLVPKY